MTNPVPQYVTQHPNNGLPHKLQAPSLLFQKNAHQRPQKPLKTVSELLMHPDKLKLNRFSTPKKPILYPLFSTLTPTPIEQINPPNNLAPIQAKIIQSGLTEWSSGIRETQGKNLGPRINQYALNAKFSPGKEWCGFFTAWNFSQAGFKYPESFASYQKARDFFLYRSYTNRSKAKHQELNSLNAEHKSQGSTRQYFMMPGSSGLKYIQKHPSFYTHLNPAGMTFDWKNLPIQGGDVALFSRGHVGLVVSYNQATGELQTVEGNTTGKGPDGKRWSNAVVRKTYQLSTPKGQAIFDGFGRAAADDFSQ